MGFCLIIIIKPITNTTPLKQNADEYSDEEISIQKKQNQFISTKHW